MNVLYRLGGTISFPALKELIKDFWEMEFRGFNYTPYPSHFVGIDQAVDWIIKEAVLNHSTEVHQRDELTIVRNNSQEYRDMEAYEITDKLQTYYHIAYNCIIDPYTLASGEVFPPICRYWREGCAERSFISGGDGGVLIHQEDMVDALGIIKDLMDDSTLLPLSINEEGLRGFYAKERLKGRCTADILKGYVRENLGAPTPLPQLPSLRVEFDWGNRELMESIFGKIRLSSK